MVPHIETKPININIKYQIKVSTVLVKILSHNVV